MLKQENSSKYKTEERNMLPPSPNASRAIPGNPLIGLRMRVIFVGSSDGFTTSPLLEGLFDGTFSKR
jgi:hypothetical protein